MNDFEQPVYLLTQQFAIDAITFIGQGGQKLDVTDQMRQTKLYHNSTLTHVASVGREVVAANYPGKLLAQHFDQHIATAPRIDLEQRKQFGAKTPGPPRFAIVFVSCLIYIQEPLFA